MTNKDKETIYKKYGYDKNKIPFPMMMIGEEDEIAKNPYTEVEVTLNPVEIAVYDCLMGSYHAHLAAGQAGQLEVARDLYDDYYKGKDWFIENNVEAYFKLID